MIIKFLPKKAALLFVILIIFSSLSSIISSLIPGFYKQIMDQGIITGNIRSVMKFLFAIVLFSLLNSTIKIFNNLSINRMGLYVSQGLKENVIKKVFHSPLNFFDKVSNGELIQRIRETDAISGVFNPQLLSIIVSFGTCILAIFKVHFIDDRFLVIYLIAFPLLMFVSYQFSKKYKNLTYENVRLNTKLSQLVHESITGINEVKSNNLLDAKQFDINHLNDKIYQKTKKQNTLYAFHMELISMINLAVSISITIVFFVLFQNEHITIGQYIEITQYSSMILAPAQLVSSIVSVFQPLIILLKRLKFFDITAQQDDCSGEEIGMIEEIEYKNVSFAYHENEALSHLDFHVAKNDKVLISGQNGAGKTTMIKLLLRLYDNYKGEILFNGMNSKSCSLKSIRNEIAVVFQDTFLFDGSLYDNIICGSQEVSKDEVIKAMEQSGFMRNKKDIKPDELLKLPIVEGGSNLSGGQKRMIAIARALVKKPSVLVLDEPTTFLDNDSRKTILTFIKEAENMIIIVISHDTEMEDIIKKRIYLEKP